VYSSTLPLTSTLDGVGGQCHTSATLPPGKTRWVGSRAGLDGCRKSRPPPGFDPRTAQPVASSYTDCADSEIWRVLANIMNNKSRKADKGWPSACGFVEKLKTAQRKNVTCYGKECKASDLEGGRGEKMCVQAFGGKI